MKEEEFNKIPIVICNNFTITVQAKTHRKKRINKKWKKRYGLKEVQDTQKVIYVFGKLFMTKACYNRLKKIFNIKGGE